MRRVFVSRRKIEFRHRKPGEKVSVRWIRARRRIKGALRIWAQEIVAPLVDRNAILQLIAYPVFLLIVLLARGYRAMSEEAFISWAATQALIYAFPAFVLVCLVRAGLRVVKEEAALGSWFGTEFVYHHPIRLLTVRVTSADNGRRIPFKVPQAEIGGSVDLKVEVDGFDKRVKAQVTNPAGPDILLPWSRFHYGGTYCKGFVPPNKTLALVVNADMTNASIIRVMLVSWNVY